MNSLKDLILGKKSVPHITVLEETTREGINKAYIPKFLYKPPFGYPRYANIPYIRHLAQTPYVEMCISTILEELCAVEWDIIPTEGMEDQAVESEIMHIKNFFMNPNTNRESFEDVFIKMPMRDVLEVNTGVLNKVYNLREDMVEVVARDAAKEKVSALYEVHSDKWFAELAILDLIWYSVNHEDTSSQRMGLMGCVRCFLPGGDRCRVLDT